VKRIKEKNRETRQEHREVTVRKQLLQTLREELERKGPEKTKALTASIRLLFIYIESKRGREEEGGGRHSKTRDSIQHGREGGLLREVLGFEDTASQQQQQQAQGTVVHQLAHDRLSAEEPSKQYISRWMAHEMVRLGQDEDYLLQDRRGKGTTTSITRAFFEVD